MKKLLNLILVVSIIFSSFSFLIKPSEAKAAEGVTTAQFVSLPNKSLTPEGYLNLSNTGFRVYLNLADELKPYDIAAFLDNTALPFDERIYDNTTDYYFSSKTSSLADLKSLLDYGVSDNNVSHKIYIKARATKDAEYQNILAAPLSFIADFATPTGTFSAEKPLALKNKIVLGVGDSVNIIFMPAVISTDIKSINANLYDRALTFYKIGSGKNIFYQSNYIIQEGDLDAAAKITVENVDICDFADNCQIYNQKEIPIDFQIDANSPQVSVTSPQNDFAYNQSTIPLTYSVADLSPVVINLDGTNLDPTVVNLINLADGDHILTLSATDLALNKTSEIINFSVDTTAPQAGVTQSPSGKIEQGTTLVFSGETEPYANVKLEIFSDPLVFNTTADGTGSWRLEIDSTNLPIGSHVVYLTVTDKALNVSKIQLSSFEISQKSLPKIAVVTEQQSSDVEQTQDVKPQIIYRDIQASPTQPAQPKPEEVAKVGQISSSSDTRDLGVNWSVWILILAMVALASALAAAGYYGYEWVVASNSTKGSSRLGDDLPKENSFSVLEKNIKDKSPKTNDELSKIAEKDDSPKRETRW